MPATLGKPSAPSTDKRWRIVEATMRRNGHRGHALIETLHSVQDSFGFLDDDSLRFVARSLNLPLSKVHGVATFYHIFSLQPRGRHTCVVCKGTACYIRGAPQLIEAAEAASGVHAGETSANGEVSLLEARCLGSCGLAPAVVMDGEVWGKVTQDSVRERVAGWMQDDH